ncbi:hypothetical protein KCU88_g5009, partial [Aureobasidium melanogenum]
MEDKDSSQDAAKPAVHHSPKPQYAFQVHDRSMAPTASSVSNGVVKAKRRRTSPQDHAILEAAYQKNSKPDKAERALIVSQVELGEKEVQIWFQNRRQNDRRRSKPLQPHELVAHIRNSTSSPLPPQVTSSPGSGNTNTSSPIPSVAPNSFLAPPETIDRPASRASSIHDLLNPTSSGETTGSQAAITQSTQQTSGQSTPPSSLESSVASISRKATPPIVDAPVLEGIEKAAEGSSEHGSARKRDHDEMLGEKASEQVDSQPSARVKEPLRRTSSMVRLSMTVDGAVKIRTDNEPTPSPEKPRALPPHPASLQNKVKAPMFRSKSAVNSLDASSEAGGKTQFRGVGAGFGRSRDARTWEFYCDSNSNDALSTQAEAETAGSALSAINLIRTNSFKSRSPALSPSVSKANKRLTPAGKAGKPKISRAKSSLGRLQGSENAVKSSKGEAKRSGRDRADSGDSDKENWAPGTQLSEHPLRRTQPSTNQRPILQENEDMTFPDASSSRKLRDSKANLNNNSASPTKVKAKGEELDCVQGLLSLSQGAWK